MTQLLCPLVSTVSKNSKGQDGSPTPAPTPVCPSTSLRNLTQCWLSVVQGQVGRCKPWQAGRTEHKQAFPCVTSYSITSGQQIPGRSLEGLRLCAPLL